MSPGQTDLPASRGAAYMRMSAEHQHLFASHQMDVIREYAKRRGMQIVKEYSDEDQSGVNDRGREI
jgi:DNA invertase Pin-like site-specific DNA recombinase